MSFLDKITALVEDPPPAYAFEISIAGIAYASRAAKRGEEPDIRFQRFPEGLLEIGPVKDNVSDPGTFAELVAALIPPNGNKRRRDAALILPDYCARVAVLDFDVFPTVKEEQLALVRFRLKKGVPFDLDAAAVNYLVQKGTGKKKIEVLVAAASYEIVAKYEVPFRAAGYNPGFVTPSTLAMVDLLPKEGLHIAVKLSGQTVTVAVSNGRVPKLVRCLELSDPSMDEIMAILFPTLAYAEDELGGRPEKILSCGLDIAAFHDASMNELGVPVEPMRSLWGAASASNAGLLGWLQAQEGTA